MKLSLDLCRIKPYEAEEVCNTAEVTVILYVRLQIISHVAGCQGAENKYRWEEVDAARVELH